MWSIVAAASYPDRVIGQAGRLPWHLPLELRLFRSLTWGGVLVMGRRTWESIGRSLPGREIYVLSQHLKEIPGIRIFPDKDALLQALREENRPIFFAGGQHLYQYALTLPMVRRMYLTWVFRSVSGDTTFPPFGDEWEPTAWEIFYEDCTTLIRAEYRR